MNKSLRLMRKALEAFENIFLIPIFPFQSTSHKDFLGLFNVFLTLILIKKKTNNNNIDIEYYYYYYYTNLMKLFYLHNIFSTTQTQTQI